MEIIKDIIIIIILGATIVGIIRGYLRFTEIIKKRK